ncbi:protein Wnt-5a-like [Lethenteron reissneri]|uniref:protein Wnt-5a-like n=1 Tax=Lethenteron reissneri TaxID=7753 RepID=UPI002AB63805|nr:protein Wnt-5a-like [Lethenteron reissneri]
MAISGNNVFMRGEVERGPHSESLAMRTPMGPVSPPPLLLLLGLCAFAQLGAVASAAWWSLAMWVPPAVDPSQRPLLLCSVAPGLSPAQRHVCRQQPHFMKLVVDGARLAIAEYRHQFQAKRKRKAPCTEDGLVPLARAGSREAAFFSALTAAGVVHAVARACNTSEVIRQNCTWTYQPWLLPGDNVKYGRHFAKLFLDAGVKDRWRQGGRRKSLSKFLLMELHNNEAGRRAVEDLSYFKCGCAERTGECVGVCLPRLQDFRSVGDFLKEKYNVSSAMRLVRSNSSSSDVARWRLQPVNEWLPAPGASELVHVEASPEYCVRRAPGGAPARRRCNDTSEANERCSDINAACCDTGYDISQVTLQMQCGCKEQLKRNVKCKLCPWTVDQFVCK